MKIEIKIRRPNRKQKGIFMQKTRFEGHVRLIRAANWTIGPKIGRAAFIFAVLMPLGGVLTACMPAKEPVVEMDTEVKLLVLAPEGAIPPAGLEKIKLGMTQAEVMRILAPFYDISHAASGTIDSPQIDQFTYEQDGKLLYGGVSYNGKLVDLVRYGYTDSYLIY